MNPKAAEAWNFALAKMESAQRYIEQGQEELAKTEIAKAVYVGAGALYYLLGQGAEEQAAHEATQSFIGDMANGDSSAAEPTWPPAKPSPTSPTSPPTKTSSPRHKSTEGNPVVLRPH